MKKSFEPKIAKDLEERGVEFHYEPSIFEYTVGYSYTPDFEIWTKTGKCIYIEAKGDLRNFTADYRKKWLQMKDQHFDCDFRFLFMNNNKLPQRKMTGPEWAEKNDVKYAVGHEVPEEWLNE